MKSFTLKQQDLPSLRKNAILLDVSKQDVKELGRLASQIALFLRGKHKPQYTPHLLCGDDVIVTNVAEIRCTTRNKSYYKHTGYPGGIKEMTYEEAVKKDVCYPLFMAVKRMLRKSKLRKLMLRNLHLIPHDLELQQTNRNQV